MKKQKTRQELETHRDGLIVWIFVLSLIIVWIFTLIIISNPRAHLDKLETQLSECQEQVPVRNSVLFYRCEGDVFHNILIDENNKSLYDYKIKKGCEVIE